MTNPQLENGYTRIANETLKALCKFRLSGNEWRVLLVIWIKTYGWHKKEDRISLSQFADMTGLRRNHVLRALQKLTAKGVTKKGNTIPITYSFIKTYRNWKLLPKMVTVTKRGNKTVTILGNQVLPEGEHTKDTLTKEKKERQAPPASKENKKVTELLDRVYKRGFNIYKLLGRFKKERTYDLPEPVIEKVCNCYLLKTEKINNEWAWFITSAKQASMDYFAERNKQEGTAWKNSPQALSLKDILQSAT